MISLSINVKSFFFMKKANMYMKKHACSATIVVKALQEISGRKILQQKI